MPGAPEALASNSITADRPPVKQERDFGRTSLSSGSCFCLEFGEITSNPPHTHTHTPVHFGSRRLSPPASPCPPSLTSAVWMTHFLVAVSGCACLPPSPSAGPGLHRDSWPQARVASRVYAVDLVCWC